MLDMTERTRSLTNIKMTVFDIVYSHIFHSVFYFLLSNIRILDHILFSLLIYFLIVFMRNKVKFFKTVWETESWSSITSSTLINGHFSSFTHMTKYTSFLFVTIVSFCYDKCPFFFESFFRII